MSSPSLEQILSTWQDWGLEAEPIILREITGGFTNRSYLVSSGRQHYVLRINNPKSRQLGICRSNEVEILRALSALKVAPKLYYTPPSHAFTVLEHIQGRVWSDRDFANSSQRSRLNNVIENYQATRAEIRPFDYVRYLENYWQQFRKKHQQKAKRLNPEWQRFIVRLRWEQNQTHDIALVHHDLIPSNIVEQNNVIRIIDWEYAGLGFRQLDKRFVEMKRKKYSRDAHQSIVDEVLRWIDLLWWEIQK